VNQPQPNQPQVNRLEAAPSQAHQAQPAGSQVDHSGPVADRPGALATTSRAAAPSASQARGADRAADEPLWEALREDRFVLARCRECDAWLAPAEQRCERCAGPTAFAPAAGTGVVDSFIVVRHPSMRAFAGRQPYALALVTLDEGIRLAGRLDGLPLADVTVGQPVRAALDLRPGTDVPTVVFRPSATAMAGVGVG
jgi:uncharacterized OB-fold protein